VKKEELDKLADHIRDAMAAGKKAADSVEDVGTCNMDTLIIYSPGLRLASLKARGVSAYRLRGNVAISGAGVGIAAKKTASVEAAAKHLQAAGYSASVWYQMD